MEEVKVSSRFSIKRQNARPGGLLGESWTFGPCNLAGLCAGFVRHLTQFHVDSGAINIDEANAELDELRNWLAGVGIKSTEAEEEDCQAGQIQRGDDYDLHSSGCGHEVLTAGDGDRHCPPAGTGKRA